MLKAGTATLGASCNQIFNAEGVASIPDIPRAGRSMERGRHDAALAALFETHRKGFNDALYLHREAKAATCLRTPKMSPAFLGWLAFQRTYEGCCGRFVRGNA